MVCYFFNKAGIVRMCRSFLPGGQASYRRLARIPTLNKTWLWRTLPCAAPGPVWVAGVGFREGGQTPCRPRQTVQQHGVKIYLALVRRYFSLHDYKSPRGPRPIQNPTTTCSRWCNTSVGAFSKFNCENVSTDIWERWNVTLE